MFGFGMRVDRPHFRAVKESVLVQAFGNANGEGGANEDQQVSSFSEIEGFGVAVALVIGIHFIKPQNMGAQQLTT